MKLYSRILLLVAFVSLLETGRIQVLRGQGEKPLGDQEGQYRVLAWSR